MRLITFWADIIPARALGKLAQGGIKLDLDEGRAGHRSVRCEPSHALLKPARRMHLAAADANLPRIYGDEFKPLTLIRITI